jgi:hypothetical protein
MEEVLDKMYLLKINDKSIISYENLYTLINKVKIYVMKL